MNHREIEKLFRENGFYLDRCTGSHYVWRDGISRIVCSTSKDPRARWNIEADVKRAVKLRESKQPVITQGEKEMDQSREARRVIIERREDKFRQPLTSSLSDLAKVDVRVERVEDVKPVVNNFDTSYDPKMKERIQLRVIDLFHADYTYQKIADTLNKEGFRNSQGNPINLNSILYFIKGLNLSRNGNNSKERQSAEVPTSSPVVTAPVKIDVPPMKHPTITMQSSSEAPKATSATLPTSFLGILMDTTLTDETKVRTMKILAGVQ